MWRLDNAHLGREMCVDCGVSNIDRTVDACNCRESLKGQCQEMFCLLFFFHESSSQKYLKITFKFFKNFAEIFASQGAPLVSATLVVILPSYVDT